MSDRKKGAALARKFGALKTAEIIATACYQRIFQSAIAEIGTAKLVDALAEAEECRVGFLRPLLHPQPDRAAAHETLRWDCRNQGCRVGLTEAQRSALKKITRRPPFVLIAAAIGLAVISILIAVLYH